MLFYKNLIPISILFLLGLKSSNTQENNIKLALNIINNLRKIYTKNGVFDSSKFYKLNFEYTWHVTDWDFRYKEGFLINQGKKYNIKNKELFHFKVIQSNDQYYDERFSDPNAPSDWIYDKKKMNYILQNMEVLMILMEI